MPEKLKKFVEEWRTQNIDISDDEAECIYQYCLRKMKMAKVENPEGYIDLLYPDEIKNYLIRIGVNATSILRMTGDDDLCVQFAT